MKVKSHDMWKSNNGLAGINQNAGRYFLDQLIEFSKKNKELEVNLIGHSAGSIAICNLLKMASALYPELVFNKIIFLAPACRIDLFNNEIVSKHERFKKFRLFTMSDKLEKADLFVPYVYTHSLLYLVSGILEDEGKEFDGYILGLERNIRALHPYDSIAEIVNTNKFLFVLNENRVIFSQTLDDAPSGLKTRSLSHGGFDDDEHTINSIEFLLKNS